MFALLNKFSHWSEALAPLTYTDIGEEFGFLSHKRGESYTDPLGRKYGCHIKSCFSHDDVFVSNGALHLETHPLSKGKIPYSYFPYKIMTNHTTGYSPWDFLQLCELSEISEKGDPEFAQGSKVLYLLPKKSFDRFMKVDWNSAGKPYYEEWKPRINKLIDKGYVLPTSYEPAQFWLENVEIERYVEPSDHLCLCLNWCNLNKVVKVKKVVEICKKLHEYTGKDIDIRLHSYSREGLFHILEELPYVHLIPYLSMSKYEVMDKYRTYFVDGTGLGYEIAYRNKYKNKPVDIFYLNGLASDEKLQGFDGIVEMGAVPEYTYEDFLKGQEHSNFSNEVIKESFPHEDLLVLEELKSIFVESAKIVKSLD